MHYAETHSTLIDAARLWVRTTSFADVAPHLRKTDKNGRAIYRTDSVDTKVADALLDLWADARMLIATAGKKTLGKLAGVSPNTALTALRRLAPWFVVIEDAGEHGMRLTAGDVLVSTCLTPTYAGVQEGVKFVETTNTYSTRKALDPYQSGTSTKVRQIARDLAKGEGMTPREWLDQYSVLPGMGETGLRVLDALHRCGEMTVDELAAETGKSAGSIRNAMPRLRVMTAVTWSREGANAPKVWELEPGAFDSIESRGHELRTWGMADGREAARLEDAQMWAEMQHRRATTDEERETAWQRRERLAARRAEILARLHPEWGADATKDFAANVPFRQWVSRRAMLAERKRASEERTAGFARVQAQRAEVRSQVADLSTVEAARLLRLAGYDAGDVAQIVS